MRKIPFLSWLRQGRLAKKPVSLGLTFLGFGSTISLLIGLGSVSSNLIGYEPQIEKSAEVEAISPLGLLPVVIYRGERLAQMATLSPDILPTTTPFQPLTYTPTASRTATFTASPTATATSTFTATPSPTRTPTPTVTLRSEARITGVRGHNQWFNLSCESRAATDWAAYYGVQIKESEFQAKLPRSDNPEKGFVGSVYGVWGQIPPAPYGVHAAPVAELLRSYGVSAEAKKGMDFDEVKRQIDSGNPVIAWVIGGVEPGHPVTYTARDGEKVIVARYEHVVLVIGYTPQTVVILDGSLVYERSVSMFLRSWAALGNMGIIHP